MTRIPGIPLLIAGLILSVWTATASAETNALVPDSRQKGQTWTYSLKDPGKDWLGPKFDDSEWIKGVGGFGREGTPGAVVRTDWVTNNIWMRRTFTLKTFPKNLGLTIHHDEDVKVYVNGQLIYQATGYTTKYKKVVLGKEQLATLKIGKNVLAVHCRQTRGGQYIDVGLVEEAKDAPVVVKAPTSPKAIAFYQKKVEPILKASCLKCHGGGRRVRGGLNLTSRDAVVKGGDTGPAVNFKHTTKSLLLKMVNYVDDDHKMPPSGKLPKDQIDVLTEWVKLGLPYTPGDGKKTQVAKEENPAITKEDRNYWAYKKPVRPTPPKVKNTKWVRNPIDNFILAKLEAKELTPAPVIDRYRLIRRATYDLTGLPPTFQEVEAFVKDDHPKAYEKLIDRLLASKHYGEKWGRHWLDLVRFAESNGYEYDQTKPKAWKYRDYVIKSFNEDKSYDQFLTEQLAGDELPNANDETRTATIYYRLGIFDTHAPDALQRDFDMYDDIVKTTSEVVLGMTTGCARCHDHKKDPILQEDYYRMLAFFRNIRPGAYGPVKEFGPRSRPTYVLVRGNAHVPRAEKPLSPGFPTVLGFDDPKLKTPEHGKSTGRRLALARWLTSKDNPQTARVMANRIWQHHFGRGIVRTPNDFGQLGESPTHPKLLDWLAVEFMDRGWSIKKMHKLIMLSSTYRMSSKDNEQGIKVDPTNDLFWRFNMRRLTAEELRDSILAVDGTLDPKVGGPSVYPELPIEVIRTSSKFDRRTGFIKDGMWQRPKREYEVRRSVYTFVRRSLLSPMMVAFDFADTDNSCAVRFATTVPTQALTMLNSKFMTDHSRLLAKRLRKEAGPKIEDQVKLGLQLVTQRPPNQKEIARGVKLIRDLRSDGVAEERSLEYFCLVALNLNEFIYLD